MSTQRFVQIPAEREYFMAKYVKCKNCGERILVDVSNAALSCEHCGKRYKNPYYVPQDDMIEEVLCEKNETSAQNESEQVEECAQAENSQSKIEDLISFETQSESVSCVLDEPKAVFRVPKKGVAIARLVFATMAFVAFALFEILPLIGLYVLGESQAVLEEQLMWIMFEITIMCILFAFTVVNFITAATCVSGKAQRMKANRGGAIASAVFSLIITMLFAYNVVDSVIVYVTNGTLDEIKDALITGWSSGVGFVLNLIVFILSCVCASQIGKARKSICQSDEQNASNVTIQD